MLPLHGIYILISLFIAFSQTKLDEFAFNKLICSLAREREEWEERVGTENANTGNNLMVALQQAGRSNS